MLRYWRGGLVGESNGVKDFVEFVDEEFGVGLEHDGFVAQLEGGHGTAYAVWKVADVEIGESAADVACSQSERAFVARN